MRERRTTQLRLDFRRRAEAFPEEVRQEAKALLQQLLREVIDGETATEEEQDEREDHAASS
jgi:hypothetical protein